VIRLANLLRYRDAEIDLFLGPGHDGRASRRRRSDSQLRKRRAHLSLCPFSHPIPPPSRILFSSTALARIRSWQCTCKSEQVPTGPSSLGFSPPPLPSFSPRVYHPRYLSLRTPVSMLSQRFSPEIPQKIWPRDYRGNLRERSDPKLPLISLVPFRGTGSYRHCKGFRILSVAIIRSREFSV